MVPLESSVSHRDKGRYRLNPDPPEGKKRVRSLLLMHIFAKAKTSLRQHQLIYFSTSLGALTKII